VTKELDEWIAKTHEEKEAARKFELVAVDAAELERKRVDSFTPVQIAPGFFAFLVSVTPCEFCATPTVPKLQRGPFPVSFNRNFEAQCQRAGIRLMSHWSDLNQRVCVGCKDAGKQTFDCAHCKQARPLNESHSDYGSPAEHLCVHCYSTVPAKQWEGLVAELEEQHRYDFE